MATMTLTRPRVKPSTAKPPSDPGMAQYIETLARIRKPTRYADADRSAAVLDLVMIQETVDATTKLIRMAEDAGAAQLLADLLHAKATFAEQRARAWDRLTGRAA